MTTRCLACLATSIPRDQIFCTPCLRLVPSELLERVGNTFPPRESRRDEAQAAIDAVRKAKGETWSARSWGET